MVDVSDNLRVMDIEKARPIVVTEARRAAYTAHEILSHLQMAPFEDTRYATAFLRAANLIVSAANESIVDELLRLQPALLHEAEQRP